MLDVELLDVLVRLPDSDEDDRLACLVDHRMKFEFSVAPVTIISAVADVRGVVLNLPLSSDLAVMLGFTTTQDLGRSWWF